ncbi:hypothetical protein OQA88_12478 [Cercophora sp. LCS_1]
MKRLTPLFLTPLAAATGTPTLQFDPATAPDCIEWHNKIDTPCTELLAYWNIPISEFRAWNPSVGLDCTPFNEMQSYCIMTKSKRIETGGPEWLSSAIPYHRDNEHACAVAYRLGGRSVGYVDYVVKRRGNVRNNSANCCYPISTASFGNTAVASS